MSYQAINLSFIYLSINLSILGDSSNRKLSARYCGTSYDADSVCGNEGKRIGIAAKGEVNVLCFCKII